MEKSIIIPSDSEGFHSLECPYCNEKFKVLARDVNAEETLKLFCPYCGLADAPISFIPEAVIEHAKTLAMNHVKQQMVKVFKDVSRKLKGPGLTIEYKRMKLEEEQPNLLMEGEELEQVNLHCCNKSIKIYADQSVENIYCPYCGVN